MWVCDDTGAPQRLEEVGIFAVWAGAVADLPMRARLYKNVPWTTYLACDQCSMRCHRVNKSMKLLGCARTPDILIRAAPPPLHPSVIRYMLTSILWLDCSTSSHADLARPSTNDSGHATTKALTGSTALSLYPHGAPRHDT
jgi:hypothetical protein